ncbi:MAG: hypothetical protein CMJ25_15780 [Phycisphaerae bacterium]|nr:hypothetical protein [Phycisphaerae bacterium]|tara:strand:- start:754 stop:1245 length:492 start_codon:yes stop_codon:yes gene_type:complete
MAQRITQMPQQALPATQESFIGSSVERGVGAMTQPNSGMKNREDGGLFTKFENPQYQRNKQQQIQDIQQNAIAAAPQQAASAMGQVTNNLTQQSTADYKAQLVKNNTIANIMQYTGNNQATTKLGELPRAKIENAVRVSQAMASRQAAELGQLQAEAGRYRQG